jgi:hypothetical protein
MGWMFQVPTLVGSWGDDRLANLVIRSIPVLCIGINRDVS